MAYAKSRTRPTEKKIYWTGNVTIEGATGIIVLTDTSKMQTAWGTVVENIVGVITNVYVQYITASDTTEVQNIRIGSSANLNAHATNIITVVGKVAGDTEVFPQSVLDNNPILYKTDKWLAVEFKNSTGAGIVKVGVEVSTDYTDSLAFTPQTPG